MSVCKIETQYMLYEVENQSSSCEETKKVTEVFIDDMDVTMSSAVTAIRENTRDSLIARLKNFFLDVVGYEGENVEQYSLDSEIISRCSSLAKDYRRYFLFIQGATTEDNYKEMCRLAMFTYDNFLSNYVYLKSLRDSVKLACTGISYFGTGEDTQEEFKAFFKKNMDSVSEKNKVYRKEEC